ncbi:MOSC N-terminal beta barrel domain-containing protein [Tersicoccus sp. MR15.9]|uniref:MOSC N-terminal beta barrel domain-containing protein n=1 Tax=Tersicoccus mangrovi TaxID=3121635 RepID=UPI002FE6006E
MPVTVVQIRRYPVKSMAGEYLDTVELGARGLIGDRWYAVEDAAGHVASGKTTRRFRRHDEVFAYGAASTPDGVVVTHADGSTWPSVTRRWTPT